MNYRNCDEVETALTNKSRIYVSPSQHFLNLAHHRRLRSEFDANCFAILFKISSLMELDYENSMIRKLDKLGKSRCFNRFFIKFGAKCQNIVQLVCKLMQSESNLSVFEGVLNSVTPIECKWAVLMRNELFTA